MKVSLLQEPLPPHQLKQLQIRCWQEDEQDTFRELLKSHHYLGCPDNRQMLLRQVVLAGDRPVALLTWTHSCRALACRDEWIGWDRRTCARRLGFIAQNNRFLLLTARNCSTPNLASKVLSLSLSHLQKGWQDQFGHEVLLAETFVDPERYQGSCYRAAGWQQAGRSAGYSRFGSDYYQSNSHPKDLWLKLLKPDALERLRDPSRVLEGEKKRANGKMPVSTPVAESLWKALRQVPAPRDRRGRQFPLCAMLATAILAMSSGSRTVSDIFRFCQELTSAQRKSLGFYRNPQAPRVVPPPGENCWRKVLTAVDPEALASVLNEWLQGTHNHQLPSYLSIDGKVIGNNLATLVSLVDSRDGTPVAQFCASGNGQEQQLTTKLVESLPEGALDGKVFSGDALYASRDLVRTLVQDKGAQIMVQLKENQPISSRQVKKELDNRNPPFST